MKNQISIIIPFLNEKEEVENTLISIRKYTNNIPIILINDASDNDYDYTNLQAKYNTTYIVNKERLGVAKSRDLGISKCSTEYFLLLDAHMRFYENGWEEKICSVLNKNKEAIVCCQNRPLFKQQGELVETGRKGYGAKITLSDTNENLFLTLKWIYKENLKSSSVEEIPNILGAAYAASKTYWKKLYGLAGLEQYGSDEVYLSTKCWLSGGRCLLIKDIEIGHIYRKKFPYHVQTAAMLYNNIIILKLLFPQKYNIYLSSLMKKRVASSVYRHAHYKYLKNSEELGQLKGHYKNLFIKNFSIIEKLNDFPQILVNKHNQLAVPEPIFQMLKSRVANEREIGLNGRMGIIISLFLYSECYPIEISSDFLKQLLEETLSQLTPNTKYHFCDGFLGIGWALEYLIQKGFVEADRDQILLGIDNLLLNTDLVSINNFDLNTGILGILHYLVARISQRNNEHPYFTKEYIRSLYNEYSKYQNYFDEYIEIFNKLFCYTEGICIEDQISIADLINLHEIEINNDSSSLFGGLSCAGIVDLVENDRIEI
ncbi:glycosyltransferase [Sphingobacterium detergens]